MVSPSDRGEGGRLAADLRAAEEVGNRRGLLRVRALMRGITMLERQTLRELRDVTGEWVFDGPTLDALEEARRIEAYDVDAESYRLRLTELGHLALRLPEEIGSGHV